jgi:AAA+ ATPase superfamily predicted ATPase
MVMRLGNKAEGADFFDRVTEQDALWCYLEGNHIVLSGPRRLGKTSLLQRLADEAEGKGLMARLVDVEGINSAEAFVGALERAFPDESITGQ